MNGWCQFSVAISETSADFHRPQLGCTQRVLRSTWWVLGPIPMATTNMAGTTWEGQGCTDRVQAYVAPGTHAHTYIYSIYAVVCVLAVLSLSGGHAALRWKDSVVPIVYTVQSSKLAVGCCWHLLTRRCGRKCAWLKWLPRGNLEIRGAVFRERLPWFRPLGRAVYVMFGGMGGYINCRCLT